MECINPNDVIAPGHATVYHWHLARMINTPVHPSTNPPMPEYFTLADQRRIERVPRPPLFSPSQNTIPAITFSVNGWPGVRVKGILAEKILIDGRDDTVLAPYGWKVTVLNLKWPGYDFPITGNPMVSRFKVCPDEKDITREGLALMICSLLRNFHQVASKRQISPDCKKWALTTGPEGIRPFDVVLLSVHYYRTTWVPEFYVIE